REGLEAALPDVAAGVVVLVVAANVGGQQPLHPGAEVAVVVGPEGEMEVVGHQAIAQEAQRQPFAGLAEELDEGPLIAVLVEDGGAAVAPVEDVVAQAAARGPDRTRHGRRLPHRPGGGTGGGGAREGESRRSLVRGRRGSGAPLPWDPTRAGAHRVGRPGPRQPRNSAYCAHLSGSGAAARRAAHPAAAEFWVF